jgi:hypothetical protein
MLEKKQTQFDELISSIAQAVQHGPEILIKQRDQGKRSPAARREYAGHPQKYIRDVLGYKLTPQQEEALELCEQYDRVLLPSANNAGKTFLLGCYGIYRFDAFAALKDEDRGLNEQGAQILLPGPDHNTVFNTLYNTILEQASRAESRGYEMPGDRSERSVHWRVRPRWHFEAFSPSFRTGQEVAHSASGRHHINQVALIEEGQGVVEALWKAVEGMCSSDGNKIISAFNPTEPAGPAFQRALRGGYFVYHLSAFDHPNVNGRQVFIPDAISYKVVDHRVRVECRDRGPLKDVPLDEDMGDFVYALPPKLDSKEDGPRKDGHLGHPNGDLRIYRPSPQFEAQVLGQWPKTGNTGLFDPGSWDKSSLRWLDNEDPDEIPDCVGVDVARTGDDESIASEMWGEEPNSLLREWFEALQLQDEKVKHDMLQYRRIRVGRLVALPRGDGVVVAEAIAEKWPESPLQIDESGVGASVLDHLTHVLDKDAIGISFAAAVNEELPGEMIFENARVAMYARAADLVRIGLVDVPDDPLLREEIMVQELKFGSRVIKLSKKKKERKVSVRLIEKDEIRKLIGRSPDRADAFCISLFRKDPEINWDVF